MEELASQKEKKKKDALWSHAGEGPITLHISF